MLGDFYDIEIFRDKNSYDFDTGKTWTLKFQFTESYIPQTVFCVHVYAYIKAKNVNLPFKAYLFLLFVFIWLSLRSATGQRFIILVAVSEFITPVMTILNL